MSYALTLVAFDEGGLITFTFGADDVDHCEANAAANGCARWIFSSERIDPKTMMVVDGELVDMSPDHPSRLAERRERMKVTRKQMMRALASAPWSFLSKPEALAALATGAVPAALEAALVGMDEEAAFDVLMTWASFAEAHRTDPLVAILAAHVGLSDAELDAFFEFAAAL